MSVLDLKYFTQPTPNPMAMKFIFNKDVKTKGKISYNGPDECEHNPLAKKLFDIECITKMHFFENVIRAYHSKVAPPGLEPGSIV